MSDHICVQCLHYVGTATPNGTCDVLSIPVWSRRPECASKIIDLFEPLDTPGNRLREARKTAGMSRDDVCAEVEVNGNSLKNWETDRRKPSKAIQKILFDLYGKNKKSPKL